MEYKKILEEWGFHIFKENFETEGITDESFLLLDEDTIKALIPKSGPRLIFKEKYYNYKSSRSQASCFNSEAVSTASTDTFDNGSVYSFRPDDNFMSLFEESSSVEPMLTSTSISSVHLESKRKIPDIEKAEEIPKEVTDEPKEKKLKLQSVFSQGLVNVLKKYPDGQLVLLKKEKLNNDLRGKLTKVIITECFGLFSLNDIKPNLFMRIAEEIQEVFPAENYETYYLPYDPEKKKGPRGKLYTKFTNTKSALKLANTSVVTKNISETRANNENSPINEQQKSCLTFLKSGVEPVGRVLESWESTFKLRRRLFINTNLAKIFEDFPCLKLNTGLELIETDFNKRFPDSVDVIYSTWEKVSLGIIAELKERKISGYGLTEDIDHTAKALLLLPYLFTPITIKKTRKACLWRPSRSEVQESFFFHVENDQHLTEKIRAKFEKLEKFNLTTQPFGVLIGNLASPRYVIIVENQHYSVETGIRALELLFKLFHALDIAYPAESAHVWQFIEKGIFKMNRSICPQATAVLTDITFHINN